MATKTSSSDDYLLGRSIISRIRLNQQHFMFVKIFGYILHPSIPTKENLMIGDVGTGTGSSTSFRGFDIDLGQTPPRAWLPPNIDLSILDVHSDLPESLVGKFDIIHVRLLLVVVKNDDPTPILRNLLRMLKPGGWLQWAEVDNTPSTFLDFISATSSGSTNEPAEQPGAAMYKLHDTIILKDLRFQSTWQNKLPQLFTETGFEAVESDVKRPKDALPWLAFVNDTVTPVYGEIIERMPEKSEMRKESEKLYAQALKESWEGTAWNMPRMTTIGRKPEVKAALGQTIRSSKHHGGLIPRSLKL